MKDTPFTVYIHFLFATLFDQMIEYLQAIS